jgi:hypothetical protein
VAVTLAEFGIREVPADARVRLVKMGALGRVERGLVLSDPRR